MNIMVTVEISGVLNVLSGSNATALSGLRVIIAPSDYPGFHDSIPRLRNTLFRAQALFRCSIGLWSV